MGACIVALGAIILGCYSMNGQDKGDIGLSEQLTDSAYCDLETINTTDGGLPPSVAVAVSRARAKERASHAALAGVLRRNAADAGPPNLGVACPP
jgi:hypothetical protein